MRPLSLLLLLIVVLGTCWYLIDAQSPAPSETTYPGASEQAPPAVLKAAPRPPASPSLSQAELPANVRKLVKALASGRELQQKAALEALAALHDDEALPLRWFVAWVLTDVPKGTSNPLVGWAQSVLAEDLDDTRPHLPALLAGVLGASATTQERVDRLLHSLRAQATEDDPVLTKIHVAALVRIYEHAASDYGLKRELVEHVEHLGIDAVPLAPGLINFAVEVLAERVVAAKEAADAGIMVSWDHVEYDIEWRLAGMGDAAVPLLSTRLHAAIAKHGSSAEADWQEPTALLASALAGSGEEGIRVVLALLKDPRPEIRREALYALHEAEGENGRVRSALLGMLHDLDRTLAAMAIELLASHGKASIPALLPMLQDPSAVVRKAAATTLAKLGVEPDDALAPLLVLLRGTDASAALSAAETIGGFGAEGMQALPDLLARLDEKNDDARRGLAEATAKVALFAPQRVPPAWRGASLAKRLGLVRLVIRMESLAQERKIPPPAEQISEVLRLALRDDSLRVQVFAALHWASPRDDEVIQVLRRGFDAEDGLVRLMATAGLALVGPSAVDLLPRMTRRIQAEGTYSTPHGRWGHRSETQALQEAIEALGRYDFRSIFALLDVEAWHAVFAAREAFEKAGPAGCAWLERAWDGSRTGQKLVALEVAERAVRQRDGEDGKLRAAGRSLGGRGLTDADATVRLKAADALGEDPASLDRVLATLVPLLDHAEDGVATAAASAIEDQGEAARLIKAELKKRKAHRLPAVAATIQRILASLAPPR